jgi:hypothetical protein
MKKDSFSYSISTSKTPAEVFKILLNVKRWWSGIYEETITGKSDELNDEFSFRAGGGAHYSKQKLVELIVEKRITWLVIESNLNFLSDPFEWTNTRICFDISVEDALTVVIFTHSGLTPEIECYNACSGGWTRYLDKLKKELS